MTPKEARQILIAHNIWRRGESDDMPNPKQIGLAIDLAIAALDEKISKLSISQNIRDAATNWPKFLGVVECEMLDIAFNCTFDGFFHHKLREDEIKARTFMLLVAEALES